MNDFIEYLVEHTDLQALELPFAQRAETRYVWKEASPLMVLSNAIPRGYFTHHTAARLHRLSKEKLKRIYFNQEQFRSASGGNLTQEGIDRAFARPQRVTSNVFELCEFKVFALNGMNTGELGVVTLGTTFEAVKVNVKVTDLERTLIDLVVRPAYAGGPDEVLNAFRTAKSRASPERIAELLKKLNYTYPYHQAIGLYMNAAGYPETDLTLFKKAPMQFDFYLAPQMSSKKFVDQWRIFVPDSIFQAYAFDVGNE